MKIAIDTERLAREIDTLAGFSDVPAPAVTRVIFSATDLAARGWFKERCHEAGLEVREDAVGNTFARWRGEHDTLPAIATGSHIDAIPNAGRYDGTVGVLGGLEAVRALRESGFRPRRSIDVILFTSEEPTRFGIGCLGSRLLSGVLPPTAGETLRDHEGKTLNEVRSAAGFGGDLESVALPRGYYAGFVELHIEQGPLLEKRGTAVGVVTAIAAPASLRITIEGEGGHAGAVLMPDRRDAFSAAAEIALALEQAARSTGSVDSVATTGICEVFPGAVNSIPSRVQVALDIRDTDVACRDGMLLRLAEACEEISQRRGVKIRSDVINRDDPARCDDSIISTLAAACEKHGLSFDRMVSRAYHDSLFMARIAPGAMVFIPCRGGVSHRPDEYSSPEAIAQGTLVLAETLAELSLGSPSGQFR
jgi:N-carbamoyl-L-amino-acid hydrolase